MHDNQYRPLGLGDPADRCGFCLTGNSGGASAIAYAVTRYGLSNIVGRVVPTGGPPHAALAKGCMRTSGQQAYWFEAGNAANIDSSYGYASNGPCVLNQPTFQNRWLADSVDAPAANSRMTHLSVVLILGAADTTVAPSHARDWAALLDSQGTKVTVVEVPGMGHDNSGDPGGQRALRDALMDP